MAPKPNKCVDDITSNIKVIIDAGDISAHDGFEIDNINLLTIANKSLQTDSEHSPMIPFIPTPTNFSCLIEGGGGGGGII